MDLVVLNFCLPLNEVNVLLLLPVLIFFDIELLPYLWILYFEFLDLFLHFINSHLFVFFPFFPLFFILFLLFVFLFRLISDCGFQTIDFSILFSQDFLDLRILNFQWLFLFFNLSNLLVKLLLSFFALGQLNFNVSWTLGFFDFPLG